MVFKDNFSTWRRQPMEARMEQLGIKIESTGQIGEVVDKIKFLDKESADYSKQKTRLEEELILRMSGLVRRDCQQLYRQNSRAFKSLHLSVDDLYGEATIFLLQNYPKWNNAEERVSSGDNPVHFSSWFLSNLNQFILGKILGKNKHLGKELNILNTAIGDDSDGSEKIDFIPDDSFREMLDEKFGVEADFNLIAEKIPELIKQDALAIVCAALYHKWLALFEEPYLTMILSGLKNSFINYRQHSRGGGDDDGTEKLQLFLKQYVPGNDITFDEIGGIFSITKEWVRRRAQTGMDMLNTALGGSRLKNTPLRNRYNYLLEPKQKKKK